MASSAIRSKTPASTHSLPDPDGGVGDLVAAEVLGVLEGAASHETHQHHFQAVPVRGPCAMTAQWMGVRMGREQGPNGSPDGINHLGIERVV